MRKILSREKFVQGIRKHLERDSFPRLEMSLIVIGTGLSGFLTSFLLLHLGMFSMWLRYLCAFGVAYGVFFIFLWLWLYKRSGDLVDAIDAFNVIPSPSSAADTSLNVLSTGAGDFSGAGASASFDGPVDSPLGNSSGGIGDTLGSVGETVAEADELAIPLVIVLAIAATLLALFVSSAVVISSAPILFAELMVDAFLSASLYHRLKGLHTRHWLHTALRKTILPFFFSAALFTGLGWFMQNSVPQAHSLGEVIHHYRTPSFK